MPIIENPETQIKRNIIYGAVMDGWKVRKLNSGGIELVKANKDISQEVNVKKLLDELLARF